MLENLNIEDVLFIDIETAPQYPAFGEVPEDFQKLWDKKSTYFRTEEQSASDVYERAGIYAEFGKIICISAGFIIQKQGERFYRVKSFYDDDEKKLLLQFNQMLEKFTSHSGKRICAHNGMEFDFPYIARRSLINGLKLPKILDIAGAKPWEVKDRLIDTLQLWKFGDYKNYTSLELLCAVFGIPTPKDDIDGSQVAHVYYMENDLDRIIRYCEKDTLALANLLLRYKGEAIILPENMEIV
ncbi:MAG TPA: 3'-5' exonuclease [Prolixibacteraceae bacterium]|nr:MAG: 3'-5' exonuclease [Bacteroidetes bacterium GWA2_42_15]HBL78425.1 3'-5' exonuclease [Prolixibacteraceae bacterium]HCU61349.1 3'-5' exonuclease [Prolixibacteraceae bacterium]